MRVLARVLNVLLTSEETLYRYRVRWLTFLITLDAILSPERFASRIEPRYVISSFLVIILSPTAIVKSTTFLRFLGDPKRMDSVLPRYRQFVVHEPGADSTEF